MKCPLIFFKYDNKFLKSNIELSPVMMPLSEEIYQFNTLSFERFKGLPGLLADSLPDRYGSNLIDAWLTVQGRSKESFTTIERLCYIGKRGMGAIEYVPIIKVGT